MRPQKLRRVRNEEVESSTAPMNIGSAPRRLLSLLPACVLGTGSSVGTAKPYLNAPSLLPVLTRVSDIRELSALDAGLGVRCEFEGCDLLWAPQLFLQDSTGGIFVQTLAKNRASRPARLWSSGITGAGGSRTRSKGPSFGCWVAPRYGAATSPLEELAFGRNKAGGGSHRHRPFHKNQ